MLPSQIFYAIILENHISDFFNFSLNYNYIQPKLDIPYVKLSFLTQIIY